MNRALALPLLLLLGCARQPLQVFHFERELMHTRWDFSLCARSEEKAAAAFEAAAAEIKRLDLALAMWRPDSEVALLNKDPHAYKPSLDLRACLGIASRAKEESGGSFDMKVGGLVQAWYQSLKKGRLPSDAEMEKARSDESIDLGALAKGYAQDKAAAFLRSHGIKAFLMNAGGQVYARGRKPDGAKWRVGVLHPREKGRIIAIMDLEGQVMSTSSDAEQFSLVKGKRYGHILDPRTGWPAKNGSASATVVLGLKSGPHPGAWADCLSTAAFVMGPEKAKAFLERLKASGILVKELEGRPLEAVLTKDLDGKIEVAL